MVLFLGHVLRESGGEAQVVGVGGVDAAQQRLHESFVRLVARVDAWRTSRRFRRRLVARVASRHARLGEQPQLAAPS